MADDKEWQDRVKGLLKAELAKRNTNYVQLAEMLKESYGVVETPQNLSNKIARGKFSAVFMLQILEAIGCKSLKVDHG
ncbi:DUF6471 domain-containing protein [Granulosicoccus sp.]|nr:DUF6471 domain-containing protein [Granulosicoccus sp.]MDB4222279.1 DUF6471 domain-containing protein [Granulosicoccus sp.]